MKIEDVINQLYAVLPTQTTLFTTSISVSSITPSGTTATVTTATAHGLSVGDRTTIEGATAPVAITSITRVGTVATAVTTTPHDLTENFTTTVTISGATEAEFNGTFPFTTQANRNTFTFTVPDSGPTTATGTPLLQDPTSGFGYNGFVTVLTVPTTTTFTYTLPVTLTIAAGGTITAQTAMRITGAVDFDRCAVMYTKQETNDLWAFVTLGDTLASKSRHARSDAIETGGAGAARRQQVFQDMSIHVFKAATDELSARAARDLMEDVMVLLFKSLVGVKFSTGLSGESGEGLAFVSQGQEAYTTAWYAHTFNFQLSGDINQDDTVDPQLSVAFRDISLTMGTTLGTGEDPLTAAIDLDDVPL